MKYETKNLAGITVLNRITHKGFNIILSRYNRREMNVRIEISQVGPPLGHQSGTGSAVAF